MIQTSRLNLQTRFAAPLAGRVRASCAVLKLLAMAMLCAITGVSAALAADQKDPPPPPAARAIMEKVTTDVLAILRDPKLSADDKRNRVKQVAYDNINFDVMARLSIG